MHRTTKYRPIGSPLGAALLCGIAVLLPFSAVARAGDSKLTLAGDQEVPAVASAGAGNGTISVGADRSVSGSITTTGLSGTAAHIHEAAPGKNGPVIVPLTKSGDTYTVPAFTVLTDAQYASYQAGNLYVNVHTAVNAGGEIRGQLKP